MKHDFICPNPARWDEIYNDLCKAYEASTEKKLPYTVVEIYNASGPPTPLILNGWVFTNDDDKQKRWQETLLWAEKNSLLYLTKVEEQDKYFRM